VPEQRTEHRTFLFTDIESSTRLLADLGIAYGVVLERHRTLIQHAVETNRGAVVDRRGDEFFAAFDESHDAVEAAVDAQRSLGAEPWPQPLRVRMGIHRGRAQQAGDSYVGLAVHHAARVCQTARGGEILVSHSVEVSHQSLDLGELQLKGIPQPTRLRRILADGLEHDFPPLPGALPHLKPLRVVLADDSVLLREGVAALLEEEGIDVVGQAGDADDLLRLVDETLPDLAIVDIRMPPTKTDEGIRAAHEIRSRYPRTGVLVLSSYIDVESALELFKADRQGLGYLLKERVADVDDFVTTVRTVAEGGTTVDEVIADELRLVLSGLS
jgi:class 3 adenylate cyclase/ActR/RegA family two-component response regulator